MAVQEAFPLELHRDGTCMVKQWQRDEVYVAKGDNHPSPVIRSEASMCVRGKKTNVLYEQDLLCGFSCLVHTEVPGL